MGGPDLSVRLWLLAEFSNQGIHCSGERTKAAALLEYSFSIRVLDRNLCGHGMLGGISTSCDSDWVGHLRFVLFNDLARDLFEHNDHVL